MTKWTCVGVMMFAFGCTKPNPALSCEDGLCSDPTVPFCDVTGSISGEPNTCIHVACTANQFVECRGDKALTCNAAGDDYDLLACPFGCRDGGCSLECPIGVTTTCVGDQLVMCDGQGAITSMSTCELGCNSNGERCNQVAPSNNLAAYLDEAATASPLVLTGAATIDTDNGTVTDQTGGHAVSSAVISGGAVSIFVLKTKTFETGGNVTVKGAKALAIVSAGDITVKHVLSVSATYEKAGPGAISNEIACMGGNAAAGNAEGTSGGGGGGFGTAGGAGGLGGSPHVLGGPAGGTAGSPELVPLRGGCPGGRASGASPSYGAGAGGGAIQLVSGTAIHVVSGGAISANGGGPRFTSNVAQFCESGQPCGMGEGAGAGGGILIEAPIVNVDAQSGLFANGGAGMCALNGYGQNGTNSVTPAAGQVCDGNTGPGGSGAAGATAAQDGGSRSGADAVGGGGGGGLGRIRVNVKAGLTFAPSGLVSGATTVGSLGTR